MSPPEPASTETPALLIPDPDRVAELIRSSRDWPSCDLTAAQLADLELLLNGGYAPLTGFMGRLDAAACARHRRLADGTPFPAPVVLPVSEACVSHLSVGANLVLRDPEGVPTAILHVDDVWSGSADASAAARSFVAGRVEGLQLPHHYDFADLRWTPARVRGEARRRRWTAAMACPMEGVMRRSDFALTRVAAREAQGGIIIMAVVDPSAHGGDRERFTTVRCHRKMVARYDEGQAVLWLLDMPSRGDVATDLLMRALVARNAGCTHLLLVADAEAALREDVTAFGRRLGITILVATASGDRPPAEAALTHAEGRRLLSAGLPLPEAYVFPEIAAELRASCPARDRQGFTVFFTGLSGSGKSTIANVLRVRLLEQGRSVTLLDGDLVRKLLSSELGFSREHRELNIRRIAFVASEITRNGGVAICAPIAPHDAVRREARRAIEAAGGFVLVFVDTPLAVCERRDRKGLYAKARAGLIPDFTGVSEAYEPPADADVVLRTSDLSPEEAADAVMTHLRRQGYLPQ